MSELDTEISLAQPNSPQELQIPQPNAMNEPGHENTNTSEAQPNLNPPPQQPETKATSERSNLKLSVSVVEPAADSTPHASQPENMRDFGHINLVITVQKPTASETQAIKAPILIPKNDPPGVNMNFYPNPANQTPGITVMPTPNFGIANSPQPFYPNQANQPPGITVQSPGITVKPTPNAGIADSPQPFQPVEERAVESIQAAPEVKAAQPKSKIALEERLDKLCARIPTPQLMIAAFGALSLSLLLIGYTTVTAITHTLAQCTELV